MEDKTQLCRRTPCSLDHWNKARTLPGKSTSSDTSGPKPLSSPTALSHNICPRTSKPFLPAGLGLWHRKEALHPTHVLPPCKLDILAIKSLTVWGEGGISDCFLITKWRGINNTMQKLKKKIKAEGEEWREKRKDSRLLFSSWYYYL